MCSIEICADEIWQIVEADGVVCKAEPAETLPLTQAYFIY